MTKPTGRPRGRPKTKEYVTLMARVPQDLADRVERYAALHQQSISVVLRDGLEVLLEEDRYQPFLSDNNRDIVIMSDRKDKKLILSDTKTEKKIVSDTIPPFDPTKNVLGKLCKRGHEWGTTGKSLLRLPNLSCRACENAAKRETRALKAKGSD